MSILSFEFLVFILLVILVYHTLPLWLRWYVLLLASGIFVVLSGWQGGVHLAAVSLVTWGGGLLIRWAEKPGMKKLILAVCLILNIGTMTFIKYYTVLSQWLHWSLWEMAVPLGLSYFTFQTSGFLIDVYRGKVEVPKNPLKVFLFAGYFPQLSQGPISNWKELGNQLTEGHRFNPESIVAGFQMMLWGYFKKLVIADRLAATTDALLAGEPLPGWFVLAGVILYAIRLYADFSGGMDVIRGISQMLGITLPENFRRPFFAVSVADYWRRWHITLGTWFRSYLLYPLTASKAGIALGRSAGKLLGKKTGRILPTALATFLIFLLIGLWHGASWNAVIYGGYFGVIMAVSMLMDPLWKKLHLSKKGWVNALRMVRTWLLILPAQYFAFTADTAQSFFLIRQTFADWNIAAFLERFKAIMSPLEWGIAGAGLLILLIVDIHLERLKGFNDRLARKSFLLRWPLWLLLILAIFVFGCYGEGFDSSAFLYTQF